ncbi:MAG: cytochrome P450 [Pseudonocardiaceae bacterium]
MTRCSGKTLSASDPDRFSPQRSKGRNRWQYLPFGGGPRSCIWPWLCAFRGRGSHIGGLRTNRLG